MHALFPDYHGQCRERESVYARQLLTSPQAYKKYVHVVHCIIPAHSVTSLKKKKLVEHPRMQDELNFAPLNRIYEQVTRDGEEKTSSLFIMDDSTTSL